MMLFDIVFSLLGLVGIISIPIFPSIGSLPFWHKLGIWCISAGSILVGSLGVMDSTPDNIHQALNLLGIGLWSLTIASITRRLDHIHLA